LTGSDRKESEGARLEPGKRVLVIGVGNRFRHDDSVGCEVAQAIQEFAIAGVDVREESGEGASLMEAWKGAGFVIIVDAAASDSPPGTIHELDAHARSIPTDFFHYSSHAFGVAEAIELARALQQLPPRLLVFGIEGRDFSAGVGLSPEVKRSATEVVERITRRVSSALPAA
jgi:hydrogenase maturation protease